MSDNFCPQSELKEKKREGERKKEEGARTREEREKESKKRTKESKIMGTRVTIITIISE